MTDEIKMNIKLIKFGYQFKYCVFKSIFLLLISLFNLYIYKPGENVIIFLCIMMVGIYIIQISNSLSIACIVKSSPKYKLFYYILPSIINIINIAILYISLIIIRMIQANSYEEFNKKVGNELIIAGLTIIIIWVYISLAEKLFAFSIIFFMFLIFLLKGIEMYLYSNMHFSFQQGIGIAIFCALLGMIIFTILHMAVYKRPISKYSQSAFLRKYM